MDITIQPRKLRGKINIIPSKSQAHRLLICAAFANLDTVIVCPETNRDIEATADCLRALGASIARTTDGYHVRPVMDYPESAILNCGESGSTLRFLLPIAGALGVETTFLMAGRLPYRPLSPLWEEMERMGCELLKPTATTIVCRGKLKPGAYSIDGGVSSQYITGLLFALSLLNEKSTLTITGKTESRPYIEMTRDALTLFGTDPDHPGAASLRSPGKIYVEGDWSNGAFFLAANTLGSDLDIEGLNIESSQGDKEAKPHLESLQKVRCTICAADIPDLVPILSVAAACCHGAVFTNVQRLRLKESDRIETTISLLKSLGGKAEATDDTLTVFGTGLTGGTVDAANDHRIAMAAAIASTACTEPVTILGAQCVEKSYPKFWEEFSRLGGTYELNLR